MGSNKPRILFSFHQSRRCRKQRHSSNTHENTGTTRAAEELRPRLLRYRSVESFGYYIKRRKVGPNCTLGGRCLIKKSIKPWAESNHAAWSQRIYERSQHAFPGHWRRRRASNHCELREQVGRADSDCISGHRCHCHRNLHCFGLRESRKWSTDMLAISPPMYSESSWKVRFRTRSTKKSIREARTIRHCGRYMCRSGSSTPMSKHTN